MNPISRSLVTGTTGELLVQLRLLQIGVQAAPPLKDSGNDLIAVHRSEFRAIQVKTTAADTYRATKLPKFYHLLAVVHLVGEGHKLLLDKSDVFLIPKERVAKTPRTISQLAEFRLCQEHVDRLFGPPSPAAE